MVIQRSNSAQTARLVGDLIGADPVRREAAVARLAIVGERAVDRLLAAMDAAAPDAAIVILRTLELIGSPRTLPAAIARLQASNDAIAIAAVGAIRPHLRAASDEAASTSLEALTTLALARERSDPPRLAALEALGDMGEETLQPIHDRLRQDPSARVRRLVGAAPPPRSAAPESLKEAEDTAVARLEAAAEGGLPDDADTVRSLITHAGGSVALSVLQDLVIALRTREQALTEAGAAATALDWMTARGAAHQALAERHSRLAVFDLRDTFEHASERLPLGFVAAITDVGDASCLPALAAAWRQVNDGWMRDHIVAAFQAIMLREGLTRRHAAVRRALERAPDATAVLTTPTALTKTKPATRAGRPSQ